MVKGKPLVSVIVPAYNAEGTLAEALKSACAQTYRNLEIVVVDDGSQDGTAALASAHAGRDPRIRLVCINNSGVAVARNTGAAAANGQFLAPLDADDLWHPCKIERQVELIETNHRIGYVYTLYRLINVDGRVGPHYAEYVVDGHAFTTSIIMNFVGNGSSPLIRRSAFEQWGGYDPSLHGRGAQGCEDYLLQTLIARHWEVRCVPEYLTGYRRGPANMSSNKDQMIRSRLLAFERIVQQVPDTPRFALKTAEAKQRIRLCLLRFRSLRLLHGMAEVWRCVCLDATATVSIVLSGGWRLTRQKISNRMRRVSAMPVAEPRFLSLDPGAALRPAGKNLLVQRMTACPEQRLAVSIRLAHPVEVKNMSGRDRGQ